ncbi:hypothetical protein [Devosia aurantiaca]|uniref:Uncharacterized protein n=1 Tax=Devosia aurantiaca TaxID=2714858 RepID=A0A6M1SDI6_9HYPH|nr:hypothetical protein [Devosia aurantiaca]NGP17949.1 hypothetical protein [Devosia aurantiaca]
MDLTPLLSDLPAEIVSVQTGSSPDGAVATFMFAEGVEPRFYEVTPSQYVLDVDIAGTGLPELLPAELEATAAAEAEHAEPHAEPEVTKLRPAAAETITPFVSVLGSTVRLVFPFDQDTPAAVFRRGDTVWMVFDTVSGIEKPADTSALDPIASEFAVISSGDTQVVRLDLSADRLATIGSEGMAWVLSLGDMMLSPTEPMTLSRRRDIEGSFEMVADIARPGRIHDFRDPLVGDMLQVVTAYPPARGVTRTLDYVDFTALRSVHGLVLKPKSSGLDVAIESPLAVISSTGGSRFRRSMRCAMWAPKRSRHRGPGSSISERSRNSIPRRSPSIAMDWKSWRLQARAGSVTWRGSIWHNTMSRTVLASRRLAC